MIFTQSFKVEFQIAGRPYKCHVDKMIIIGHRPEKFFRVGAHSGNRDLICHEGRWMVCNSGSLPNELLDALGAAIDRALQEGI